MVAGNLVGSHYNTLIAPASASSLTKPALNLVAFGWAIFGYTFVLSTLDFVRWRPNLIASVATLAGFIALVLSNIPQLDMKWLEKFSIFKAYDPVEAVIKGENLAFNAGLARAHRPGRGGPRLRHLRPPRPPGRELSVSVVLADTGS